MSSFLLVVPDDWTQLNLEEALAIPGSSLAVLKAYIQDNNFATLAEVVAPMLPAGAVITAAQIINDEAFIVQLG